MFPIGNLSSMDILTGKNAIEQGHFEMTSRLLSSGAILKRERTIERSHFEMRPEIFRERSRAIEQSHFESAASYRARPF